MTFPAYPAYKDSGVEWLGAVPDDWVVRKVSVDFSATKGPRGALLTKEYCHENSGEYPVYSGQTENGGVLGEIADFDFDLGRDGAILSTTVGAKAMSVSHITGRVSLSQNCMIIKSIGRDISTKFFFYHFQPLFLLERRMIPDHMQPSFRMEDLYSFRIAVPPDKEQTQIARFLDHETARIDALIEEQQRLIELLKEKRQAVISHAVTKGLDPTVPMKDSGVEWLGEVPAHWVVGPLRWYATIQGGIAKGKDYEGRQTVSLPYLRVANVQNGFVDLTEVKEISVLESEVERYSLRLGDVLMNEGGDNDKLGRGTVWQGQIEPCLHQNHVFAIRPNDLATKFREQVQLLNR